VKPKAACVAILAAGTLTSLASTALAEDGPAYRWKKFVAVEGQPEPVPAEWVSTPEGRFAHSIRIPNPVPKDSGYRPGMNSTKYFEQLCSQEAGEFKFTMAEGVEGLMFMRPPSPPTDNDLMDRYKLEAPGFERVFQLMRPVISERGAIFGYGFAEEPNNQQDRGAISYLRASRLHPKLARFEDIVKVDTPLSRYGMTWRGLRRDKDREHAIAGAEIIVLNLASNEVMGVLRDYVMTGRTPNVREGVWWLNAVRCSQFARTYRSASSRQLSDFVRRVLKPQVIDR
jgi:hypothetical protein